MFTKVQTNAVRHKNNFKGIEYDLDTKVTKFMELRENRMQDQAEKKREKDMDINYKTTDFDEDLTEEEVRVKNDEMKQRIKSLMRIKSVKYDEDCLDICRPFNKPYTL